MAAMEMTAPSAASNEGRRAATLTTTPGEDLVSALLGVWAVVGLYLDGWAHHTRPEMESFFTPWHAVLYSGAGAATIWLGVLILRRHTSGRAWRQAVPPGYGLGLVGALGFGAAGLGDLVWHTIFGVEADLEALLSPSHLLLFFSGLLMLTSPARAAWLAAQDGAVPSGLRALLPTLVSLTSTTAVVAFFFHYLSPTHDLAAAMPMGDGHDAALGLGSIFLTNVILVGPLVFLVRAFGPPPFGAATLLFTAVTSLLVLDADFAFPAAIPAAFAGGLVVDGLFRLVRPSAATPRRFWLAAALAPLPLWGGYFLSVELTLGVMWSPELWAGATVMAALIAFGLAFLTLPVRSEASKPLQAARM